MGVVGDSGGGKWGQLSLNNNKKPKKSKEKKKNKTFAYIFKKRNTILVFLFYKNKTGDYIFVHVMKMS